MSALGTLFAKLVTGSEPKRQTPKLVPTKALAKLTRRDLIRMESKIGSQLFGPVPKGHRREFFCLDEHTWIWYEEWSDAKGKRQSITTRYEVHPNNILKVQDNQPYQVVEGEEGAFVSGIRSGCGCSAKRFTSNTPFASAGFTVL